MKKITITICMLFAAYLSQAQETKKDSLIRPRPVSVLDSGKVIVDGVVRYAEVQPEFPGGPEAMNSFLNKHLMYPEEARENNKQGTVYAKFVVNTNGVIDSITIIKTPCACFNEEVIRVIKKMPPWKPGFKEGKAVRTEFTLPVMFRLN